MVRLSIVDHSGLRHTRAVAEFVHRGAAALEATAATLVSVDALPAPNTGRSFDPACDVLREADAIIFGCPTSPTYRASVSAGMKRFMEHSSGVGFTPGRKDKLAAAFTNAGGVSGDKLNVLRRRPRGSASSASARRRSGTPSGP